MVGRERWISWLVGGRQLGERKCSMKRVHRGDTYLVKSNFKLLHRHVGTGKMHHAFHADFFLHAGSNVEGEVGGGATGTPCNVAKSRAQLDHT